MVRRPRTIASATFLGLSVRVLMGLGLVGISWAVWKGADPYPTYDRPRSLFFGPYRKPRPEVIPGPAPKMTKKTPPPPPVLHGFIAESEDRSTPFDVAGVELSEGTLVDRKDVSQNIETKGKPAKPESIALGFVADCSLSMSWLDASSQRVVQAKNIAKQLKPEDRTALFTFCGGGWFGPTERVLVPWTSPEDAQTSFPNQLSAAGGHSDEGNDAPYLDAFRDPQIDSKKKVVVMLSDLTMNDGRHVLKAARDLSNQGVIVYAIRFGDLSKRPSEERDSARRTVADLGPVCQASGGALFEAGDANGIAGILRRIAASIKPTRVTRHRLVVRGQASRRYRVGETVIVKVRDKTMRLKVTESH